MADSKSSLAISRRTPQPTWTDAVKKQGPKVLVGTISLAILIIGLLACLVAMGKLDQYSIGKLSNIPLAGSATMMGVGFLWLGALCVYHFRKKEEATKTAKPKTTVSSAPKTASGSSAPKAAPASQGNQPDASSSRNIILTNGRAVEVPALLAENLMSWHKHAAALPPEELTKFKAFVLDLLAKAPNSCYYFEDQPATLYISDTTGKVTSEPLTDAIKASIQLGGSASHTSLLEHTSTQSRSPCPLPPLGKKTLRQWYGNHEKLNDQQLGTLRKFLITALGNRPHAFFCIKDVIYQTDDQGVLTREKMGSSSLPKIITELSKTKTPAEDLIDRFPRLTARNFGIWHDAVSTMNEAQFARFEMYIKKQLKGRIDVFYCLRRSDANTYYFTDNQGTLDLYTSTDQGRALAYYSNGRKSLETVLADETALPPLSKDTLWAWHASFYTLNAAQKKIFLEGFLLPYPQMFYLTHDCTYIVEKNTETQQDEVIKLDGPLVTCKDRVGNREYIMTALAEKQVPKLNEDTFLAWCNLAVLGKLTLEQQREFADFLPGVLEIYPNTYVVINAKENEIVIYLNDGKEVLSKTFSKNQNNEMNAFMKGFRPLHDVI